LLNSFLPVLNLPVLSAPGKIMPKSGALSFRFAPAGAGNNRIKKGLPPFQEAVQS
jgi:hypothetical protein